MRNLAVSHHSLQPSLGTWQSPPSHERQHSFDRTSKHDSTHVLTRLMALLTPMLLGYSYEAAIPTGPMPVWAVPTVS